MTDPVDPSFGATRLPQLAAFAAVAETGSIGRAAQRLGTTQPPLSRLILRLERHLGVALVHRHSRGVSLTAAGTALLPAARRVLAAVAEFDATAAAVTAGRTAVVRVGTTEGAAALIRDTLRAYAELHPDVEVRLHHAHTPAKLDLLRRGELDVAFVRNPTPTSGVRLHPLVSEPLVAVVAADHPLAARPAAALADLAPYPLLLTAREVNPGVHDEVRDLLRRAGISPRFGPPLHTELDGLTQVAASQGWTLLAASAARSAGAAVVALPLTVAPADDRATSAGLTVTVTLAWRTNPSGLTTDFVRAATIAAGG